MIMKLKSAAPAMAAMVALMLVSTIDTAAACKGKHGEREARQAA